MGREYYKNSLDGCRMEANVLSFRLIRNVNSLLKGLEFQCGIRVELHYNVPVSDHRLHCFIFFLCRTAQLGVSKTYVF